MKKVGNCLDCKK